MDIVQLEKALNELESIEKERIERRRSRGIDFYVPNLLQFKAHQSKARTIMFVGGNRSGKSTFGAAELVYHLTRQYPEWVPKERRFTKPIKAVVVGTENSIIEKVLEPKIREYLPRDYVKQWKMASRYLSRIVCIDGSTVDFLTNEQDDMAFESADFDFFWGDEPQKKRKYYAIRRGLVDRGGKAILTFTPLIEPWMKEELFDKADGVKIEAFVANIRDNKFDIKGNAILKEHDIVEFESSLPEDYRETRISGRFFHLRGIVYTEFCDEHLVTESEHHRYKENLPVIVVLDPHDRQPHHVIWAYVDRNDDVYVHSELDLHCTVEELAKAIKEKERQEGYNVRMRLIDPNFGRKPLITTGRNMIQELGHAGCGGWYEADDPKEEGRLKVKEFLHFDKTKPVSFTNRPKLFFFKDRVQETIYSIRNHQYDEWEGKSRDEKDPKEVTKDKKTHGADTVRYLCMTNPRFERFKEHKYELTESPY